MTLVVAFVVAAAVGAGLWHLSRPMFEAPVLQRTNYRGHQVPVAAGVILVATVVAVEAGWRIVEVLGGGPSVDDLMAQSSRLLTLMVILGFGLLGAFDDVAAHGEARGFRGHLTSMGRGQLTTGGLKLTVGGLLAVIPVSAAGADDLGTLALGALVVALSANLGNLFDRAPGRTTKISLVVGAVLVAVTPAVDRPALTGLVLVLGAALGLLLPDLREELMLGDAGANVLGAALGLGVVLTTGAVVQGIVLVILVVLNLASERVSFSRVIDGFGPLRVLDRAGRRPPDTEPPPDR